MTFFIEQDERVSSAQIDASWCAKDCEALGEWTIEQA